MDSVSRFVALPKRKGDASLSFELLAKRQGDTSLSFNHLSKGKAVLSMHVLRGNRFLCGVWALAANKTEGEEEDAAEEDNHVLSFNLGIDFVVA